MYSLGIILFEMWHQPFSTGMERINTIVALRDHMVRWCLPWQLPRIDCP